MRSAAPPTRAARGCRAPRSRRTHAGPASTCANVDFLDATDADTGVRLPRRAAHQETVGAGTRRGPWRFGAEMLFVGSRPDNGIVLGGYAVVDLRVVWQPQKTWWIEAK